MSETATWDGHRDVCGQCRDQPFDLCDIGVELLKLSWLPAVEADPARYSHRCRWCGAHGINRVPDHIVEALGGCRARLAGPCEVWEPGMEHWPQFIELDEYIDEKAGGIHKRGVTRPVLARDIRKGDQIGAGYVGEILRLSDGDPIENRWPGSLSFTIRMPGGGVYFLIASPDEVVIEGSPPLSVNGDGGICANCGLFARFGAQWHSEPQKCVTALRLRVEEADEVVRGIAYDVSTSMPAAFGNETEWYRKQLHACIGRAARALVDWKDKPTDATPENDTAPPTNSDK